jgi:hypothetical protein
LIASAIREDPIGADATERRIVAKVEIYLSNHSATRRINRVVECAQKNVADN